MKLDDEQATYVAVILIVVALIVVRSCIPLEMHHPAERPAAPPESLYK